MLFRHKDYNAIQKPRSIQRNEDFLIIGKIKVFYPIAYVSKGTRWSVVHILRMYDTLYRITKNTQLR